MRLLYLTYALLRWLILLLFFLLILLFLLLNSPAPFLTLLQAPLAKEGISYGHLEGGVLSGFKLTDVNYQNQLKAKKVAVKVNFDLLKQRVLYVDYLEVEEAEIKKDFLAKLLDSNSTQEPKSEGNVTLPFDKVMVKKLSLSLENTSYEGYHINHAKISVNNFESDMKSNHKGEVKLLLDSNVAQLDVEASMREGNYAIKGLVSGEQTFLNPILREHNLTVTTNPTFYLTANGDMERLNYHLKTQTLDLNYQAYTMQSERLNIKGYYDLKQAEVQANINADLNANVATLTMKSDTFVNLNEINNSLKFDVDLLVMPKQKLLNEEPIQEQLLAQNIQIVSLPKVVLLAKGNMRDLAFDTHVENLKIRQDKMDFSLNSLALKGDSQLLKGDVKMNTLVNFDSTFGKGDIKADSLFNYKDINKTLLFTFKTDFEPKESFKTIFLAEQNLSIEKIPSVTLFAKGGMQKVDFKTTIDGLKVKQEKISLLLNHLALDGVTEPIAGESSVALKTDFDATVGKGEVEGKAKFNFNHLEESLHFDASTKLALYEAYLNPLLKESNLTLKGNTLLDATAQGTLEKIALKADLSTQVIKDEITSAIKLTTQDIALNLKEEQVCGSLDLVSDASNLGLHLKSSFEGNYMKPKELQSKSNIEVTAFNAFGVNLTPLMPLEAQLSSSSMGAEVHLDSPKLTMDLQSSDYEHVVFSVKSEKIFPSEMFDLPQELEGKFVKLNLKGKATLSQQYFTLVGVIEANKKFALNLKASSTEVGLDVNIFSKHLKLNAKGDLSTKQIRASLEVDSLKEVQKEFQSLYDFAMVEVDGELKLNASLNGEEVKATIHSPKIALPSFAIEELAVDGVYDKALLTLNRVDFKTTGFENKKLNQHYYLNEKGLVNLGDKRDVYLNMHPNILVKASGEKENLEASVKVESLALGYPEYGDLILSCDVDYQQKGAKKEITGAIFMDKMKLHYESKFLDPSHDNDVIILSKDDNNKGQRDSFLEDTAIDLSIYAKDANYKTRDIDLKFMVDIQAKKDFGKPLGMLGKVKEINGRVEQAPKLFTVVDSNIVFKGEKEINPLLDIAVEYELPDILITIYIHGNAKRPKITFSSEPPLPKKDILSYLLLGVSTAALGEGKGSLGREAELFVLNQAARDLAYEVELDRVFVKDDGTGEGYAIQLGKKLNDKTMFILENSKEGNSFILEYEVNKNIKVEVGQHQKTVPSQSIDLFFRKRFK